MSAVARPETPPRKLLLVVGFDASSRAAIPEALQQTRASGLRLEILHVQRPDAYNHDIHSSRDEICETLRNWIEHSGGVPPGEYMLRVERGDLVEHVIRTSRDGVARVVFAQRLEPGENARVMVKELVDGCSCPVAFFSLPTLSMRSDESIREAPSPYRVSQTRESPPSRPFKVLFALQQPDLQVKVEGQREALLRAYGLSRVFGGELHVVRILRTFPVFDTLVPHVTLRYGVSDTVRAKALRTATLDWCRETIPDMDRNTLTLREGPFLEEIGSSARELQPSVIVFQSHRQISGRDVAKLANATQVSVLVAKPAAPRDAIVAATDMSDPRFPVLNLAAAYSQHLHAPLVLVHNAPKDTFGLSNTRQRLSIRLANIVGDLDPEAEGVLSRDDSVTHAILATAREREADLVVVGARPRSWLDQCVRRCVASQVVDEARRSVLVTPIEAIC